LRTAAGGALATSAVDPGAGRAAAATSTALRRAAEAARGLWEKQGRRVTKRCKTLSGHNVVEGKDFKNTA